MEKSLLASIKRRSLIIIYCYMIYIYHILVYIYMGFPGSSTGNESACNAEDSSSIPGSGRYAGQEIGYPTTVFLGFPSLVTYYMVYFSPFLLHDICILSVNLKAISCK